MCCLYLLRRAWASPTLACSTGTHALTDRLTIWLTDNVHPIHVTLIRCTCPMLPQHVSLVQDPTQKTTPCHTRVWWWTVQWVVVIATRQWESEKQRHPCSEQLHVSRESESEGLLSDSSISMKLSRSEDDSSWMRLQHAQQLPDKSILWAWWSQAWNLRWNNITVEKHRPTQMVGSWNPPRIVGLRLEC